MAKPISFKLIPLDERILIRVQKPLPPSQGLVLAERNVEGKLDVSPVAGSKKKNVGIVVAVGPGSRGANGERIPIDKNIAPGATIHFEVVEGCRPSRPAALAEEMEKEDLWFIIESQVICVETAAPVRNAVMA